MFCVQKRFAPDGVWLNLLSVSYKHLAPTELRRRTHAHLEPMLKSIG
jgi:hypothetical protein